MSTSLRIIFAGTLILRRVISTRCYRLVIRLLAYLLSLIVRLAAVKIDARPVKVLAETHGLPLFQPASLRPQENQQLVADLNADVMVVVAYGLILPKAVLDMPRPGCVNVHGSCSHAGVVQPLFSALCGQAMLKLA